MNENSPCMGCPNRHPACHGECDSYKEWLVRHHEQQQYLKETRYRWAHPWSPALEKRFRNGNEQNSYLRKHGGSQ
jgi:hypothetical protein